MGRRVRGMCSRRPGSILRMWTPWMCVIGLCLTGLPEVASAQVPRIQGQGAAASAMSNAFSAQADDPSALHYNPAGMTQLQGIQVMAGALASGGTTNFTSLTGVTASGDRNGSAAWPPPGHTYITANLKSLGVTALGDLSVGIGLTAPFGSLTRWPNDGPFRSATTFSTLPLLDIKPTLAYKVTENLSLGLGADIYTFSSLVGEGQAERHAIPAAGVKTELNGKDTAAGFNASLLYTALRNAEGKPLANIGIVYRSQATLHLSGALLANGAKVSDANATLVLPQIITGAIAIWPVRTREREWKLEMDVDYVGWTSVRNLDVTLVNGTTIAQPQNWHSTYAVMLGTEYKWLALESLPNWEVALRGGYTNQQNQMPDLTYDPGIPSSDLHIVGGGVGLLCKEQGSLLGLMRCGEFGVGSLKPKAIGIDLSFQAGLYEDRTVLGNRNPTVDGTYRTTLYLGSASIRMVY
jgi:long-chain fatty acid transport protein